MLQQLYPLSLPVILGCDLAGVVHPTPSTRKPVWVHISQTRTHAVFRTSLNPAALANAAAQAP